MAGAAHRATCGTTHSLTAPARPAYLNAVHELLEKVWRAHPGLTGTDRARFESAVIEIVGNVVVHAPAVAGHERVTMTVLVSCDSRRLMADVRDDGYEHSPDGNRRLVTCLRSA